MEDVQRQERAIELDGAGGRVTIVPFWTVRPYEILMLPYKMNVPSLLQLQKRSVKLGKDTLKRSWCDTTTSSGEWYS
ncbi:hypothetical protein L204_101604 [Cryptococcus depauperatus]